MMWLRGVLLASAVALGVGGLGCTTTPAAEGKNTGSVRQAGVAAASVSTDSTTYATGSAVQVDWSGLPGSPTDWIGIAKFGSPATSYVAYTYTGGAPAGSYSFPGLPDGEYEARAYANDSFVVADASPKFTVGTVAAAASVTTNPSYAPDSPINVTFSGLPGNAYDWIAISTVGAPNSSYLTWKYTGGLASGTIALDGVAAGTNYVARAFENNGLTLLGESTPFNVEAPPVGTTVTTAANYPAFSPITVNFTGLPGNAKDWIAISTVGAPTSSYLTWVYTNGAVDGSVAVAGVAAGSNYVARAFENDGFTLIKESAAFTVGTVGGAAVVTTDKSAYTAAESATVSFTGMSGSARDWIAIAVAGSDIHDYLTYQYTGGGAAGSSSFSLAGLNGSYVARGFTNDSFTLADESPAFTVGTVTNLSTNKSAYNVGEPVVVAYNNLPGNARDWIAISPAGSPDSSYIAYQYTGGNASGTATFNVPAGSYEARAYENDTFTVLYRSATFTVNTAGAVSLSTNSGSYTEGQTITVTYSNMSGSAKDWISIVPEGSADHAYTAYVYTGGATSGTATFATTGLSGSYVARAYFNDSFVIEATSPSFTVTPAGP